MRKVCPLVLILALAASSIFMVGSSSAASRPSPPEFTVQYGNHPYDVPTTYTTDIYTGETIAHQGYRVQNRTIDLIIENQPFSEYGDGSGNVTGLYYNVRVKGHFGSDSDWKYYPEHKSFPASSSSYTTISFSINGYSWDNSNTIYAPAEGKLDFQVQAIVGYYFTEWVSMNLPDHPLAGGLANVFHGQKSDWSNIQILEADPITQQSTPDSTNSTVQPTSILPIPSNSPAGTTNPTSTPIQLDTQTGTTLGLDSKDVIIVVLAVAFVIAISLIVLLRRRRV